MFELLKLAARRLRSSADYRAMQEHIARATVIDLEARGIDLGDLDILELGAGEGGYSQVYSSRARSFVASDIVAKEFFRDSEIDFRIVDVNELFPFDSERFDLIFCSSVIEHVADSTNLLTESHRVLRPSGRLFLSFPPFYSLSMVGGHQFKPFHFLGEKLAVKLANRFRGQNVTDYRTSFDGFGLYPLWIDQVAARLRAANFDIEHTFTRMSRLNTARLPWRLKDLFTWHVCFLASPHSGSTPT